MPLSPLKLLGKKYRIYYVILVHLIRIRETDNIFWVTQHYYFCKNIGKLKSNMK